MADYTPSPKDTKWWIRRRILSWLQTLGASAANAPGDKDTRHTQLTKILRAQQEV
jgi:hypothetical protein